MSNKESTIVDDFMYGSNVAQSHVYVRLGKLNFCQKYLYSYRLVKHSFFFNLKKPF